MKNTEIPTCTKHKELLRKKIIKLPFKIEYKVFNGLSFTINQVSPPLLQNTLLKIKCNSKYKLFHL